MGKGGYSGGSTVIRPGSDWFGHRDHGPKPTPKPKPKPDPKQMSTRIAEAAKRLAAAQAEYDRDEWTAREIPAKVGKLKNSKRRKKKPPP